MIETITLKNYKGHTDTTIPCSRLTVLVGENASGKTSVLELVRDVWGGVAEVLPRDYLRRGAEALSYEIVHRGGRGRATIDASYRLDDAGELRAVRREVRRDDGALGDRPVATLLTLTPRALAASSTPSSAQPALGPDGAGLASVLAHLLLTDAPRFYRIVERLRAVVPHVRDVTFERVPKVDDVVRALRVEGQQVQITEKVTSIHEALRVGFVDAPAIPASQVSEGTLLTLGVLTAIETLERDQDVRDGRAVHPVEVLLIDDIDRALHPRAQRDLLATLRLVLGERPSLQVLATSHSPYLVDALTPDEVVVLGRGPQGAVVAKRLDDFPDARLRAMLSTGELWIAEGDDWVRR